MSTSPEVLAFLRDRGFKGFVPAGVHVRSHCWTERVSMTVIPSLKSAIGPSSSEYYPGILVRADEPLLYDLTDIGCDLGYHLDSLALPYDRAQGSTKNLGLIACHDAAKAVVAALNLT